MDNLDIKTNYKFSKFGTAMYKLCARWTKFLVKHRWLYYLLACTWGFCLTLFGLIVTLVLLCCGSLPHKYCWVYYQKIGPDYWGGFETGLMFVRDQESYTSLDAHEFGHTFQNCLFGPLQVIWSLSSVVRYWYRYIRYERKGKDCPTDYDAYWLEAAASDCGTYASRFIGGK